VNLSEELESYCAMNDRRYKLKREPRKLTAGPVPIRMLKAAAAKLRRYERDLAKLLAALEFYAEPDGWNLDYPGGITFEDEHGHTVLDTGYRARHALRTVTARTKRDVTNGQEPADGGGEGDAGGAVGE
jgi:hypothetical protein